MADAPAMEYPRAMDEGSKSSAAYSGRMSPALGLRRLISAMTAKVGSLGCSVSAAMKSLGGSVSEAMARRSSRGVESWSASSSARLWSMMSRSASGMSFGVGMWLIVGVVFVFVSSPAFAQAVDTTDMKDMSVDELVSTMRQWKLVMLGVSMVLVLALLFAGGLLKPGGFKEAGLRDLEALPGVVLIFAGFVVMLAQASAVEIVGRVGWIQEQGYEPEQMAAMVVMLGGVFGVIAAVGMLFVLKKAAPEAGLKLSPLDFPVGLGCFVLAYPFIELMGMLGVWLYQQLAEAEPESVAHPTLRRLVDDPSDMWTWGIVGAAVIAVPVIEEVVYRVFLQGALLKWLKSPWMSIIVTSLIFALMHRVGGEGFAVPWHAVPVILALGVSCGVAYERTKRVGVPIGMHICFNALNVVMALILGASAAETGV